VDPDTQRWPAGFQASDQRLLHQRSRATGIRQFGTGRKARVAAACTADALRDRGIAAAALFKPSMDGWIVQIYPGGVRRRA